MTVRIWETIPQAKEVFRLQVHTSVVAICWLQYDHGVVILFSDGSTDICACALSGVSLEE